VSEILGRKKASKSIVKISFIFVCFFETGSPVVQAGLEFVILLILASQVLRLLA
jgi:hypothetical protein